MYTKDLFQNSSSRNICKLNFLSKKKMFSVEMPIPVVIILLEGDVDSIEQVMEATRKGIPVIIIKGSGKAADIILNNLDR